MLAAITQGLGSSLPEAAGKCAGMEGSEFLWDSSDCRSQGQPWFTSPSLLSHTPVAFNLDGSKISNTGEIISRKLCGFSTEYF